MEPMLISAPPGTISMLLGASSTSSSICVSSYLPARSSSRSFASNTSLASSPRSPFFMSERTATIFFSGDAFRLDGDFLHLFLAHEADGALDEVAHHALHVPAHVTDFGVLGGFDLDEGRLDQLCEPAGDLRFAHARRPLHDDVFGSDLLPVRFGKLAAAIAVAQGDRHRALGLVLPDDIFIQFVYDLFG